MSADKRIAEKLDGLIYDLERLDIWLDNPASDMTMGEYEDKRKEIIESCAKSIEDMLGAGTCHDLAETPAYRDKTEFKCSECGYEYSAVGGFGCDYGDEPDFNFCPNCGRKVIGIKEEDE